MPNTIYVLGHKNPDSDAICAAIGYAALLRAQGHPEAVAARQGSVRRETAYVLDRFGLPMPLLVTDAGLVYATALQLSGISPAGKGKNTSPPLNFIAKP